MSEPVAQATLRVVKVFWGLNAALAYKRHFPAIDWLTSYSLYAERLENWYDDGVSPEFVKLRGAASRLLFQESKLNEIVRLIGMDALSPKDRLTMEAAKSIREDFLHQNAFHETDAYTSLTKQFKMLKLIVEYYNLGLKAILRGADIEEILEIEARNKIGRVKYAADENSEEFDEILKEVRRQLSSLDAKELF